jgi:hypothetical protein
VFLGIHNRINTELNVIVLGGMGLPDEDGAHFAEFSQTVANKQLERLKLNSSLTNGVGHLPNHIS